MMKWAVCAMAGLALTGCGRTASDAEVDRLFIGHTDFPNTQTVPADVPIAADQLIEVYAQIVTGSPSDLVEAGYMTWNGNMVESISSQTISRGAMTDYARVWSFRLGLSSGQLGHQGLYQQQAYIAGYDTQEDGAMDPRIDVLAYGQTLELGRES